MLERERQNVNWSSRLTCKTFQGRNVCGGGNKGHCLYSYRDASKNHNFDLIPPAELKFTKAGRSEMLTKKFFL